MLKLFADDFKTKIYAILILSLISILFLSSSYADNNTLCLTNNKSIYLLICGYSREDKLDNEIPMSKIVKLDIVGGKPKISIIQCFDSLITDQSEFYYDYGFLTLRTQNSWGFYDLDMNIVPFNEPWSRKVLRVYDVEHIYPIMINHNLYLVSLRFEDSNNSQKFTPKTRLIEYSTLNSHEIPIDTLKEMNMRRWLSVRNKKLYLIGPGLENLQFSCTVPEEMMAGLSKIQLISNTKERVILRSPYHGQESWVFLYDKPKSKWSKFTIEGSESDIRVINVVDIGTAASSIYRNVVCNC